MRSMEDGPHANQRDANPTSGTLADFGPSGAQQRLDVAPAQIRGGRLREDPPEGATVTAVHAVMIS
jgi:hypothetical protein